jgi:hypothetical protein
MTKWAFELGQTVYLSTDPEQIERIVTERKEQIGGTTQYGLSTDLVFSFHYAVEINPEFDELKALNVREKENH